MTIQEYHEKQAEITVNAITKMMEATASILTTWNRSDESDPDTMPDVGRRCIVCRPKLYPDIIPAVWDGKVWRNATGELRPGPEVFWIDMPKMPEEEEPEEKTESAKLTISGENLSPKIDDNIVVKNPDGTFRRGDRSELPIDEEFLLQIGFSKRGQYAFDRGDITLIAEQGRFELFLRGYSARMSKEMQTRGDIVKLCEALGVP